MIASHEWGVIRNEDLVSQGLVAGYPLTLDLDDDNIGFGGEVIFNVNLDRGRISNSIRKAVRGCQLGCIVRVLRSSSRKIADEDRAMGW